MVNVKISANINNNVSEQAKIVAKKRHMTFSKLVEVALVHEMNNNNDDNGTVAELKDIRQYITDKIDDLTPVETNVDTIEVKDINYYVNDLKELQRLFGFVSGDAVMVRVKQSGVPFEEFKKVILDNGIEIKW